jgi:hypothetical protein
MALHDLPTGAMRNLERFLDAAAELGVAFGRISRRSAYRFSMRELFGRAPQNRKLRFLKSPVL